MKHGSLFRSAAIGAALLALPGAPLAAQSLTGVAALADSIAGAGDTTRAYALLDSALRANKQDAAAWHQFGLLNWNMARSKRDPNFISDKRVIRLLQGADTALRLATQFAPDSARYWLSLGRFNLGSGVASMRFAASGQVENALGAARRAGDLMLVAAAADEVGMAVWRRYEPVANRALTSGDQPIQLQMFNNWSRDKAKDFVGSFVYKIDPPTGQADYEEALRHFRYALESDPTSQRIARHLYMALGEKGRWEELRELAVRRLRQYPLDHQSWLARGLAEHRLANAKGAAIAFDSAFALMDDAERDRLARFTRILRPTPERQKKGQPAQIGDSVGFMKLPAAQRRGLEAMYWLLADPLALTSENEVKLEFLARVVYADFRWSDEDLGLRGADSDRGDVFVRYGPPDLETTVARSSNGTIGGTMLVWAYNNGLVFFFDLPPGFGTARFAFADRDNVDQLKNAVPARFDNIPATKLLDTIPVRVARFRAAGDSADAVVAARIPTDSLVRGLDMTRVPVDVDFRIFDQFVRIQGVDSDQASLAPDSSRAPTPRTWTRRLGPGINVVRIEALQADSRRAARAVTRLDPEPARGFGMSDVLLGSRPAPKGDGAPRGWRDVAIEPSAGTFAAGTPIGLVWELYELAAREGSARYRVAINVERTDRSPIGAFTARVIDGLGRAVGRAQARRDNLTISFDRSMAAQPTLVELLSLDLGEYPPGAYRLRVDVTDLVANRKTSRTTDFEIR